MISAETILERLFEKYPWLKREVQKIQEETSSREVLVALTYSDPSYEYELNKKRIKDGF